MAPLLAQDNCPSTPPAPSTFGDGKGGKDGVGCQDRTGSEPWFKQSAASNEMILSSVLK